MGIAAAGPLTLDRVFTAWRAEPAVLVAVVVLGAGYLLLVRRRTEPWPPSRTASFLAGVATVLLVGCSFLGVYGTSLFWVRATQNTVLLMVTPMLLALGAPIRLVADALPAPVRAPLRRALYSGAARALTFPLVVTVVLVVPLLVLYLSPLYEITLRDGLASGVAGTVIAFTGFLYYWSRFRVDPTPRTDSYLVTLWITIVEMIGDAVLGVVLWLGPLLATGWYAMAANGLDPRVDQTIGAGILWIGGDVVGLPFILIVVSRMSREDAGRAAVVDAELDAREAAEPDTPPKLWWEDDPSWRIGSDAPDGQESPPSQGTPTVAAVSTLTWLEAIVIGAVQGVAELFPVSSLGHSILIPAVIGGDWARDLDVSAPDSPYLAFVVGLHVATAIALIIYFRRDWVRIVRGIVTSIARRDVTEPDQRLAWLLVVSTIPVGLAGLLLDHVFRLYLAKPVPTALFLALNGVVLLLAERLRQRADTRPSRADEPVTQVIPIISAGQPAHRRLPAPTDEEAADRRLSRLPIGRAVLIGTAQIAALLPGDQPLGATMVAGLTRGLSHSDAARFSFLLATPVILAAGLLKLGDLAGPAGDGIRPQILVGSLLSGIGAYVSVKYLTHYFETRSLRPFGIYCLVAGLGCLVWFLVR